MRRKPTLGDGIVCKRRKDSSAKCQIDWEHPRKRTGRKANHFKTCTGTTKHYS